MSNMLRFANPLVRTLLFSLITAGFVFSAGIAIAQEGTATTTAPKPPVVFPISELGGCESKVACRAYCEVEANREACVAWGESHGLMKREEAQKARQILKIKGPGGCTSPKECRAYCEAETNKQECQEFAKNNNLLSPAEQKLRDIIASGAGPGDCKTLDECKSYCEDTAHGEECRAFAKENNIPMPRLNELRKDIKGDGPPAQIRGRIQDFLDENPGPGGCTTVAECKTYCADTANSEACIAFGRAHQLITGAEADRASQVAREVGPGGCRGMACKEYCADEAHTEECLTFAQSRGIMSPDAVRGARTLLIEGGPGGCKGPEECKAYCADAAHVDECTAFAQQNGITKQREVRPLPPQIRIDRPSTTPRDPAQMGAQKSPEERCKMSRGTWDGSRCVPPAPRAIQDPGPKMTVEERCGAAGGSWDGIRCTLPNPAGTQPSMGAGPRPDGAMPMPETVEGRCKAAGGSWDGSRCVMPPRRAAPLRRADPIVPIPMPDDGPASLAPYSPFAAAVASLFVPFFR